MRGSALQIALSKDEEHGKTAALRVRRTVELSTLASPRSSPLYSFLVVDDDMDAADALAAVLRLDGHDCIVAYDGRTSLDEARRFHVDVVILDINMPGLDGYETASCLLNAQVAQPPILIALTALSSRDAKVNAMKIGFDGFLVKPTNPHRLMDLVNKLVSERRLATATAASFQAHVAPTQP